MSTSQTVDSIQTQTAPPTASKKKRLSHQDQAIMWVGIFIGVFFSQLVMQAQAQGTNFNPTININPLQTVVYAVITIAITPFVYEKINIDPDADFIYKIGMYVLTGIFFPTILNALTVVIGIGK